MEDLFGLIFDLVLEFLLELALGSLVAGAARAARRFRVTVRRGNPVITFVVFTLVGALAGFLSVSVLPHPLVHPSRFHWISLLLSPVLTGLVLAWIGRAWKRRGKDAVRIESFAYGFTFALALALMRFWLVR